jgi:hypothetical protein
MEGEENVALSKEDYLPLLLPPSPQKVSNRPHKIPFGNKHSSKHWEKKKKYATIVGLYPFAVTKSSECKGAEKWPQIYSFVLTFLGSIALLRKKRKKNISKEKK